MDRRKVVIVGGGFSGVMFALHLLADPDGPEVTLIEREGVFGLGAAYATRDPEHYLNTRAGNMSAFPDRPDHFLRWLLDRSDDPSLGRLSFVQRMTYGAYVQDLLAQAAAKAQAGRRLIQRTGEAVGIERLGAGFKVELADGERCDADAVVLALGNLAPADPPVSDRRILASPRYVAEPWRADLAQRIGPDETVFMIGAGLTMIDAAVTLAANGHRGRLFALSRRGLLPRPHIEAPPHKLPPAPIGSELSDTLHTLRAMSRSGPDWRTVFDGLRPVTKDVWESMPDPVRRRFLRHVRPWWDVHRHRLAPRIAERIEGLLASGQLRVAAGRLVELRPAGVRLEADWRPRGESAVEHLTADWVVNCIGPEVDVERSGEKILASLLRGGLVRPDRFHLGLEVDPESRLVDAQGRARTALIAVGPLTRSAFWEATAVPDIRHQVADAAARLAAHLRKYARPDPAMYQRADI